MSTDTKERLTRTVAATVMTKAEAEDGFKLELTIPEFKSDYPTIVNRVPAELAAQVKVGMVYNLVLEQQNLKRGKTGERPYDYYWGLRSVASARDSMPESENVQADDRPEAHNSTRDATRVSIERQTALARAVDLAGHNAVHPMGKLLSARDVLVVATAFAKWLETGLLPAASPTAIPGRSEAVRPPVKAQGAYQEEREEEPPF